MDIGRDQLRRNGARQRVREQVQNVERRRETDFSWNSTRHQSVLDISASVGVSEAASEQRQSTAHHVALTIRAKRGAETVEREERHE